MCVFGINLAIKYKNKKDKKVSMYGCTYSAQWCSKGYKWCNFQEIVADWVYIFRGSEVYGSVV